MMPETPKSSVTTTNPKPINVFYIWYTELCRRLNSHSAVMIRPSNSKCNTVLDFVADRLKFEDWSPLLNALRHDTSLHVINIRSRMNNCQFLHEVDTENKARRMKRKYGALWTDFILNSLVKSLSFSMRKTEVLTCLELDGLPLFSNYLDGILKAMMENRTIKNFSLTNCPIQDAGCQSVCSCLQLLPNVQWLNLSRCELSSVSGMYIAKLIKFQQLNRYTTSWHKSLRYSDPDPEKMCGIRRITLNCNPKLGDEGLAHILNELEDDLWIKALDVQKCGITEGISNRILDVLQYSTSIKIADFRLNEDLHPCTLEKILDILREKEKCGNIRNDFQWCNSVVSVQPSTAVSSSRLRIVSSIEKDKSSISQTRDLNVAKKTIKRSKTSMNIARKSSKVICSRLPKNDAHAKKFLEIKIMNTKDFVVENPHDCGGDFSNDKNIGVGSNLDKTVSNKISRTTKIDHTTITNSIVKTLGKLQFSREYKEAPCNTPVNSPLGKKENTQRHLNGIKINGLKNGFKKDEPKSVSVRKSPNCLFESMIKMAPAVEEDPVDIENYTGSYVNQEAFGLERSELSDSQASLFDLMQTLIHTEEMEPEDPKKFKSKQKRKKNGIK